MEQTLQIIEILIVFAVLAYMVTIIFHCGLFPNSIPFQAIILGIATILFILHIIKLIMQVSLNQSYGYTIFLLFIWVINIFFAVSSIAYQIRKNQIERNNLDSEDESDNQ